MVFRPRPYDPDRKNNQTPAQRRATDRNFRIFKLHGLHAQVGLLTGKRRDQARRLVNDELRAMGARTPDELRAIRDAELDKRLGEIS